MEKNVIEDGEELISRREALKKMGALAATAGILLMSGIFSRFIAVSYRYPLVYGSLASIILLMVWLFLCSQTIYLGAAVNACLDQQKTKE